MNQQAISSFVIEPAGDTWRARGVAAVIAAILIAASSFDLARAADKPRTGAKASKQETTGVVSGLALGAAAGGPIGAILGAAGGAWLGDRWHRQQVSNRELSTDLTKERGERTRLTAEIAQLNSALTDMEVAMGDQAAELDSLRSASIPLDDLFANVHFRTSDTQLTADVHQALRQLGAVLATRTERTVYVSGFADARGAPGYNFELSTARAEAVADALVEGGLPRGQLVVAGLGPRTDGDCLTDTDSCAFERRVAVSMLPVPTAVDATELAQVRP